MKTMTTMTALLAVMLCGCRASRPVGSTGELGGHALAAEEPRATPARMAAMSEGNPRAAANSSNLPVSELLDQAEQAIHAQQLVVARGHLQSILFQQPDHPRAHHLLAVIADLDGRFNEAEQHYFAALTHDPQNATIVGDLGYSYYLQSRFEESEQSLRRAVELDPQQVNAARNLAQLYSDRGEAARAEQLLRSTLPPNEVELALQQLRRQSPRENPSLLSNLGGGRNAEPTGAELTRQIREQMDHAARIESAAREQRLHEQELREASVNQSRAQFDRYGRPVQGGEASANPWSRQLSAIDREGVQTPPSAMLVGLGGPAAAAGDGQVTEASGGAAGSPAAGNDIQSVGGQSNSGELPLVQPAYGTRAASAPPAAETRAAPEHRQWPPATWAPLTDADQPPAPGTPSTQHPRNPPGTINPVSGTVNPWDSGVRHAVGQGGASDVERAHFDDSHVNRAAGGGIQPVAAHQPNTPASIPQWNGGSGAASTPMAQPAVTPRSAPGTGSVLNGAQYPPPQRNLPGTPQGAAASGLPVISPAGAPASSQQQIVPTGGSVDSGQTTRQSYDAAMNERVEAAYARTPAGQTPSAASGGRSPLYEPPTYPYPRGPAESSAPPVSPTTGTPWPTRTTDAGVAPTGWSQGATNASPPYSPGIVVPEPYRGGQQTRGTTYER